MKNLKPFLIVWTAICIAVFSWVGWTYQPAPKTWPVQHLDKPHTHFLHTEVTTRLVPTPCGRHYVVCSGVHSVADFYAAQMDPTVFGLYGFLKQVHPAVLDRTEWAYDSYRVGHKIYWTKTPRLMLAGEPIITDGEYAVLQRCGNMISLSPQIPVEETPVPEDVYPPVREYVVGPAPEVVLSAPPSLVVANQPPVPIRPAERTGTPIPTVLGVPTGGSGGTGGSILLAGVPSTPTAVPEASTGEMLILGLALVVVLHGRWRKL